MLNELESESPQMYEAMYNIQAQALTASAPQARDSGTVMCEALHLHSDSLPVWIKGVILCFCPCSDYSELPPLTCSNGPRDPVGAYAEEEEENSYDYPKPHLSAAPARRTLSDANSSSSAFSRLSLDSDLGAAASKSNPGLFLGVFLLLFFTV